MNKKIFALLMLPVAFLAFWSGYEAFLRLTGTTVVMPIKGYDPRDLLAGRYLMFHIDYGNASLACGGDGKKEFLRNETAYICLKNKRITRKKPKNCDVFLRGKCLWGRFREDVSRYYVPENKAAALEADFRQAASRYEIELSVQKDGRATVKNLLIDSAPFAK